MRRIAGEDYPIVHQTVNTCGLASMAMIFLKHQPEIGKFLVELFLQRYHGRKPPETRRYNRDRAVLWAEGYLLLKCARSRKLGNWITRLTNEFDYMDFQIAVDLLAGSPIPRRLSARIPGLETARKYYRHGIVRKLFLDHYLEQYKTQVELKILGTVFGFTFIPYPGDVMGNLYFTRNADDFHEKFNYLKDALASPGIAVLLGQGQSHWMVPYAMFGVDELESSPNAFSLGINDPMGRRIQVPLSRFNNTYLFYFFKHEPGLTRERLGFLREFFGLA